MSQDTRSSLWILLAVVLGGAMWFAAEVAIGSGECDISDCSWLAELADKSSAVLLAACLLFAGALVWGISRLIRRIASRRPMSR